MAEVLGDLVFGVRLLWRWTIHYVCWCAKETELASIGGNG